MSDSAIAPGPATVAELIEAFGGNAAFARVIGKAPSTVGEQKRNGSIPVEYWEAVVEAAARAGIAGVSCESLVRMHARPLPAGLAAEARR